MTAAIKDAAHVVDAASVMGLLSARPRMLALGEPTHGEDTLLELRNELYRELVEQEGYRTITIESDCMMGLVVDDYVTSGTGTLDEVMEHGFSHGWGASQDDAAELYEEMFPLIRQAAVGVPGLGRPGFAGIYWPS